MRPFDLFTRPSRPAHPRSARLAVEFLEHRESPASLDPLAATAQPLDGLAEAVLPSGGTAVVQTAAADDPVATQPAPTDTTSGGATTAESDTTVTTAAAFAATTESETTPPDQGGPFLLDDGVNQPPRITSFDAVESTPGLFLFTGTVSDESPGGMVVNLSGGPPTVQGMTITVQVDGTFARTIQLQTDGTDSGTVEARTQDNIGQPSNVAYRDVAPTITP